MLETECSPGVELGYRISLQLPTLPFELKQDFAAESNVDITLPKNTLMRFYS